jgi:RpiB/LacA/LacB family sugar-phosphate isomerase
MSEEDVSSNKKEVILIGSDHRGFDLKVLLREHLIKLNYEVMDVGTHNKERCDYPSVAKSLVRNIMSEEDVSSNKKEVILIGSDHRGFDLKVLLREHLIKLNYEVMDVGTHNKERCDYPPIAKSLCKELVNINKKGILICGSGFGMSITANRMKGIHAVVPRNIEECKKARQHGNVNVLCIGTDFTADVESVNIVDTFLNTGYEELETSRYSQRIKMIDDNEDE